MRSVLEVCVDSTASALAAKRGGADRLELCADLIVGGTTPSLTLVQQVKAETGLPVRALLRPRFGDFCQSFRPQIPEALLTYSLPVR